MPMSMSTLYIDTYTYTRFVSASMQGNERYTHMSIYTYIHIYRYIYTYTISNPRLLEFQMRTLDKSKISYKYFNKKEKQQQLLLLTTT